MMRIDLLSTEQRFVALYMSDVRRLQDESDEDYDRRWRRLLQHYQEVLGKEGDKDGNK